MDVRVAALTLQRALVPIPLLALAAAGSAALAQTPAAAGSAAGATAAPEAPVAAEVPSIATGRRAYTSYCTRCHGINLVVGGGAFFDLRTFPSHDKERFMRSLRQGLRAMPAWDGIVKPHEMESLWLYVASVNGWPASPHPTQPSAAASK